MNPRTGLNLKAFSPTPAHLHVVLTLLSLLLLMPSGARAAYCPESFDDFLFEFTTNPDFAKLNVHRKFSAKERLLDPDGRTAKTRTVKDSDRIRSFGGRIYPGADLQREMDITVELGLAISPDVRIVRHTVALTRERINYGFRREKGCWKLWYKEYIVRGD